MTAIHEITPTTHPAVWALLALGDESPERLWVRGNADALTARQSVAVTGARACTSYGSYVGGELATELAKTHTIVTGGAYGIDAQAVFATLTSGGTGVIVAAGGVDRVHPRDTANSSRGSSRRAARSSAKLSRPNRPPGTASDAASASSPPSRQDR